ncbi:dethiobiotin synthase [Dietzia natronolimnaea]|uniref:ATP-dependent dethiobiotin synthetase BioD n=2 Tax=Dietzia natronolimnaea TaxID=161920 RepID=UPI0031FA2435
MTAAATPVLVTGTGTDVGKTIATAALAALARSTGLDVGICKPVQTGLAPGEPGDADEAARLSRVQRVLEVRRLPDPLAPETAARVAGVPQATLDDLLGPIRRWLDVADDTAVAPAEQPTAATASPTGRLDLIEGAGGVLVRLGTDLTVLDLARSLAAPVVVVARAGLGTLSDTELTVRAIDTAGLRCAGIVIGSWPYDPDLAERCNLEDLPRLTGVPVLGRVPAGAGQLDPAEFTRHASGWFAPGALDAVLRPSAAHLP